MSAKRNREQQRNVATRPVPAEGSTRSPERFVMVFSVVFGLFLGLCLLKFGNPPILEKYTTTPADIYEWVFASPWPISWAYRMLVMVMVLGILCELIVRKATLEWNQHSPGNSGAPARADKSVRAPKWLLALPATWLLWVVIAGTKSVDSRLTSPTLTHFVACVACFYLGCVPLGRLKNLWPFWLGILGAFLLVLAEGWEQHFGGLAESRRFFFAEVYPKLKEIPPEQIKKMMSDRIFSTTFYPNALAGVILLLLPPSLSLLLTCRRFTLPARCFLAGTMGLAALACLYWSGSKGGWLLMLLLGIVAFLKVPIRRRLKVALIAAVLVLGLAGFFARYLGFFQKGATSVSARFDYWRAAAQISQSHPWFGTGPGTFAIPYQKLKRPESEMSRLTHNDYLQQASDSGLPACLAYVAWIFGSVIWSVRRVTDDWRRFALWLGVLGWTLQSLMEFPLYLPGLAWPALSFLGYLAAREKTHEKTAITLP